MHELLQRNPSLVDTIQNHWLSLIIVGALHNIDYHNAWTATVEPLFSGHYTESLIITDTVGALQNIDYHNAWTATVEPLFSGHQWDYHIVLRRPYLRGLMYRN